MSESLIKSRALKDVIQQDGVRNRLKEIMGARAPQFSAALVQLVAQSFQLQKCDPNSVIGAALTAAALDLSIDPNLGEAHVVPYRDKATFQIGYVGFGQLAQRSGMYKNLGWCVLHEGELIRYDELSGELEYRANNPDGPVIGYAAKFKLVNGFERAEFWSTERIEKHAFRYSASYRYAKGDPKKEADCRWVADRDRMALKTVLKSLLRTWGPKSIQMQKALKVDEGAIVDAESETVEYVDNQPAIESQPPDFQQGATEAASEPPKADQKPEPKAAKSASNPAYNRVKSIRGLIALNGLEESQVVSFLVAVGTVDQDTETLDDVQKNSPDTLVLLEEQWADIVSRIKEVKK
jgi:recombination protein RecT